MTLGTARASGPCSYAHHGKSGSESEDEAGDTEGYFQSYAHHGIHAEMILDAVRTDSYRAALLSNPSVVKGKVVLDIGCGTSILAMFAAQAGARHVYAVDNSSIAVLAQQIVARNSLADKVTVLRCKAEDVVLPEPAALIVSEWMGYALLFEAMLDSVIAVRDKHLRPDGHVFPDKAALYIVGLSDIVTRRRTLGFWADVCRLDIQQHMVTSSR